MHININKLGWCTDIHLNFLERDDRLAFYHEISKHKMEALMITGDIAEAPNLIQNLTEMQKELDMPIYFVLGNHDFWRSSQKKVQEKIEELDNANLIYLNETHFNHLNKNTILVGVDGWADARLGNYENSHVQLVDSQLIKDLSEVAENRFTGTGNKKALQTRMQKLADYDAWWLSLQLNAALERKPKRIIVATHIPPFKEASKYRGEISNDSFLPFYTCKATGDILLEKANAHKKTRFQVYCGHTHGAAYFEAAPNLIVEAGAAEYREPKLQKVIDI